MKKYKHKRTGWVVKEQLCWYDAVDRNTILNTINKEIVENSNDWEEIKDVEVCGNGMIIHAVNCNTYQCHSPVFNTSEARDVFSNKLKALKKIREWHAENDWFMPDCSDHTEDKYSIYYWYVNLKFLVWWNPTIHDVILMPYFSTEEKAGQCIKECKPELNILFDVEE